MFRIMRIFDINRTYNKNFQIKWKPVFLSECLDFIKSIFILKIAHDNVVVVRLIFMDKKIVTKWHGVLIPLPNDVWGLAEGSSLSEEQKQVAARGGVVRKRKSNADMKFFASNSHGHLMSCIVSVAELNNLAQIHKK